MSKSPNRLFGVVFGVVYLLVGILGFFLTSSTGFISTTGPRLASLFQINPLHNVVHVVIGAALLIAGLSGIRVAKAFNTTIGALFLLVGIVGIFIVADNSPLNVLALNGADNVLNFATAAVLLTVGIGADRSVAARKTA